MTREEKIEKLISNDINDIEQEGSNNEHYFIDMILRKGYKGYETMTDEELENEYKSREFEEEVNI